VNGVVTTIRPCPTCGRSSFVADQKCGECLAEELASQARMYERYVPHPDDRSLADVIAELDRSEK
jgi:hypothetical protein